MKKTLFYVAALLIFVMMHSACSNVQRILNTRDTDIIFEQALNYYNAEKWAKAYDLFEFCEPYVKNTVREDSVCFFMGRCSFMLHQYGPAATQFDDFRHTYGRSVFIENAEALYAISLYNMCPPPERDQSKTTLAIAAISDFMSHYPESPQLPLFLDMTKELTWRLHEKAYLNAYTYFKIERYDSAIIAFRNALKKYPTSHRREDLMYYIVMSGYKFADSSVEAKRLERYMTMLDSYYSFVMEYPESKYKEELDNAAEVAKKYIEKNKKEE
ncbi:MAG: outer membrane protein assembly factor BamD [Alistipes sp.]|nr:outer membrane protein assembly factor BamD [Alistipes sp.]